MVMLFPVCSLYNNVLQPSKLIAGADFHCFKAGIEPKWEDPKCAHGGKWTAQPPRSGGKAALDTYWLHTVRYSFPECCFCVFRIARFRLKSIREVSMF